MAFTGYKVRVSGLAGNKGAVAVGRDKKSRLSAASLTRLVSEVVPAMRFICGASFCSALSDSIQGFGKAFPGIA